jgi:hypothetical protein
MTTAALQDVASYGVVDMTDLFRTIGLLMETVNTSETSASFNETTWRNIL